MYGHQNKNKSTGSVTEIDGCVLCRTYAVFGWQAWAIERVQQRVKQIRSSSVFVHLVYHGGTGDEEEPPKQLI